MDTVLVTGPSGGVGAWAVGALADAGREVIDPATAIDGPEAVLIVAAENFLGRDTAATIAAVRAEVPPICDVESDASVFDCSKAERLLGWEPDHSWRGDEDASGSDGPGEI